MKDIYQSISLDNGRVFLSEENDVCFVQKITTEKEIKNTIAFSEHLAGLDIVYLAGVRYKITVPQILDWNPDTSIAKFEFKEGSNLEEALKKASPDRFQDATFVKDIFEWMKSSGTFWRGAAPRHIIINKLRNEVSLLDFERPIKIKKDGFEDAEFQSMVRGLVHEEFCAFLFDSEQSSIFPHIWDHDENQQVEIGSIFGKRINLLIKYFFDPKDNRIPLEQLLFVYKFMSSVVTPYLVEGKPFYPIPILDKIAREPEDYVKVVTNLIKMDRQSWPHYLGYENS